MGISKFKDGRVYYINLGIKSYIKIFPIVMGNIHVAINKRAACVWGKGVGSGYCVILSISH